MFPLQDYESVDCNSFCDYVLSFSLYLFYFIDLGLVVSDMLGNESLYEKLKCLKIN